MGQEDTKLIEMNLIDFITNVPRALQISVQLVELG